MYGDVENTTRAAERLMGSSRMLARGLLTQRIMMLHGNTDDLLLVCRTVYEQGRANGILAPVFYDSYEAAHDKAARRDHHLPGMGHERNETT